MSDSSPILQRLTAGGAVAEHPVLPVTQVVVAPTNSNDEHNTLKSALIPFACWRAGDMRFDFASSFVLPEIAEEVAGLKELIDKHTLSDDQGKPKNKPALSVFGHADPTGNDDFNKALSGRRAQAIYGMLTRRTDLWEELFNHPADHWGKKALGTMLDTVSPTAEPERDKQLTKHQGSAGERKTLYKAYMDVLCTSLVVAAEDFLAAGKDKGGKGDFQGCGEFNPIFLQSQADIDRFNQVSDTSPKKPLLKAERDAANEPDRRVLIFLFRPGLRITPEVWPCPRVIEGGDGCRKRFFSNGDKRRNTRLPDKPRTFDETKDTFACRFYDRLSNKSPCEQLLSVFRIRLFDRLARPLPNAPFVHNAGRSIQVGRVGDDAFIILRDLAVPTMVNVKWSRPRPGDGPGSSLPNASDTFEFEMEVAIDIPEDDEKKAALLRLKNLGYVQGPQDEDNIRAFQVDYKQRFPDIQIDGTLNVPTKNAVKTVHDACDPVQKNQN